MVGPLADGVVREAFERKRMVDLLLEVRGEPLGGASCIARKRKRACGKRRDGPPEPRALRAVRPSERYGGAQSKLDAGVRVPFTHCPSTE